MPGMFFDALYEHGWAIVSGLTGGIFAVTFGALFNAYAGEKGKLLALGRNLEQVKEHTAQTTAAAKNIEFKLSGDLWEQQHRWESKRDFYSQAVVTAETAIRSGRTLERQLKQWLPSDNVKQAEFEQTLDTIENTFVESYQELEMAVLKGRLFVDKSIVEEWKQLQGKWAGSIPVDHPHDKFAKFGRSRTGLLQERIKESHVYIPVMIDSIITMRERIFEIAEKDLRLT